MCNGTNAGLFANLTSTPLPPPSLPSNTGPSTLSAATFSNPSFDPQRYIDAYFQTNPESTAYKHLKELKEMETRGKDVLKESVVGSYRSFVVAGRKVKEARGGREAK